MELKMKNNNFKNKNLEKIGFNLNGKFNSKIYNTEKHINKKTLNKNSIIKNNQKIFSIRLLPTLIILSLFLFLSTIAFAIPNSLTLQGKLTNLAGITKVLL